MQEFGQFAVIAIAVGFGGFGLALCWVGYLAALVTALGNKDWANGIGMIFIPPLCVMYCLTNRQIAAWPRKLLLNGMSVLAGFLSMGAVLLIFA